MAKTAKEVVQYFENLYASKAVYVWGFNGQIINEASIYKAMDDYRSNQYNYEYYMNKLAEGNGRIGADCSGSMYPMSGFDATAQGYYNKCTTKGSISYIDRGTVCLVFKGTTAATINHIGLYCGNGYVIEMRSSKDNCVKSKLEMGGWKFFGIPTWIDYNIQIKAVDISEYNTVTNWDLLASQINNIIIRIGRRGSSNGKIVEDARFKDNIKQALARNMKVGVYFYDQSINEAEAIEQADWVINQLSGYKISLPVYIDSEYANSNHNGRADIISKDQRTKNLVAFCNRINTKYVAGVYASDSWFKSMVYFERLRTYEIWCARYSTQKPTVAKYEAWQYGSENYAWATKPIDSNWFYKDYNGDSIYTSSANNTTIETPITIMGIVTGNNVNIRKAPNTSGEIVGRKNKGNLVQILAQVSNGWYKVGIQQYICGDYIRYAIGTVVDCNKLWVRSAPDKTDDKNKLTHIVRGTKMYIASKKDIKDDTEFSPWYQVLLADNTVGWVSGKYIKVS